MQDRDRGSARPADASLFADTLATSRERPRLRHGVSGPLGLAAHGALLATIVLLSILSAPEHSTPTAPAPALLRLAPPPPPPVRRGASTELETSNPVPVTMAPTALVIPDAMLTPTIPIDELPPGAEDGFDDGQPEGWSGGLPGGVVGGVPGGVVGGVIGGTGDDLLDFPTPDVGPKPLRMPPATYTVRAARENVRGSVKLRVVIDEQGKVRVLDVLRSIPLLDDTAIRTVESSWRFQPATKNGRPVACLSDLVVRFNLY